MKKRVIFLGLAILMFGGNSIFAQGIQQTKGNYVDKFRQLDEVLPTPNVYRNASGAPGHEYWQQEVDYEIVVSLDEENQHINGTATISYQNNSPDTLNYLWFQLDQNRFQRDSMAELTSTYNSSSPDAEDNDPARISLGQLRRLQYMSDADHGYQINGGTDNQENQLRYTTVGA